jgi:hypothetical protein
LHSAWLEAKKSLLAKNIGCKLEYFQKNFISYFKEKKKKITSTAAKKTSEKNAGAWV